jgi:ABC-type phosphate/phosphonate transport system ATPase subunit
VFVDEPVTGLDEKESAIIMTSILRELVNQDRTVICTVHQVQSTNTTIYLMS